MKLHLLRLTIASLFLSFCTTPPSAAAADIDAEREVQRSKRARERSRSQSRASRKANERKAVEGAGDRITYQQIFKNPDNIKLNYRYAKQQINEGDLKGASATLERILMIDPALPRVRLLLAVVHLRLDNLYEAQRELNAVKDKPMPDSLRAEIAEYLAIIRRRLRKTNFTGRMGIGFQFDTNRNSAPDSGRRLFLGSPLVLTTGLKQADQGPIALGSIGVVHDFGVQEGHQLVANLSYYQAEQIELDILDLQAYSWDAGLKIKTATMGDFMPSYVGNLITLSRRQPYLRAHGFRLNWTKTLSTKTLIRLGLRTVDENFIDSKDFGTATERSGNRTDFTAGVGVVAAAAHFLTADYTYTEKSAFKSFNTFYRHQGRFAHQWLLGKGRFLLTSVTGAIDRYSDPERAIDNKQRKDDIVRFGMTIGTPLSFIAKSLKSFVWTFGGEVSHTNSNLENYTASNQRVNTMLTYKFDY